MASSTTTALAKKKSAALSVLNDMFAEDAGAGLSE